MLLSGLLILASFWHWAYWDLDLFLSNNRPALQLLRIFGIHLALASLLCFGFGLAHLTGKFGPGAWTSDSFGISGSVRYLKASASLRALAISYGSITCHHILAGSLTLMVALWHISSRPGALIYKLASMGNIESVLSSSIAAVFFTAFITSATMWYASITTRNQISWCSMTI